MDTGETTELRKEGYRIKYIKPCLTDKKRKMAEAEISGLKVGSWEMEKRLKGSGLFDKVVFSRDIGVARAEKDGATITIFNTGQITFRNMEDEKKVGEMVEKIFLCLSQNR